MTHTSSTKKFEFAEVEKKKLLQILVPGMPCAEIKNLQRIKFITIKDGFQQEGYQIIKSDKIDLYNRVDFIGSLTLGQPWWQLLNVTRKDLDRVYILCRRPDGKDAHVDLLVNYAMLEPKADGTPEPESPSPTTTPTTTPTTLTTPANDSIATGPRDPSKKSSQLHIGAIVAFVFSIIVAVVKSFEYCKRSSANKTVVWV